MYNSNTDSLGLILDVEVFLSLGHCSGALWFGLTFVSSSSLQTLWNFAGCWLSCVGGYGEQVGRAVLGSYLHRTILCPSTAHQPTDALPRSASQWAANSWGHSPITINVFRSHAIDMYDYVWRCTFFQSRLLTHLKLCHQDYSDEKLSINAILG